MVLKSFSLLLNYSRSSLRSHAITVFLAAIGLTLSVALYCSIRLANDSVLREFRGAVDAIVGTSTFQIVSKEGEFHVSEVVSLLGTRSSLVEVLPIRKGRVRLKSKVEVDGIEIGEIGLIGLDIFSEKFSDLIPPTSETDEESDSDGLLSYSLGIAPRGLKALLGEDELSLIDHEENERTLRIEFVEEEGGALDLYDGKVVIADLSLVDELLGRPGTLTEINIYPKEGVSNQEVKDFLEGSLPSGLLLTEPDKAYQRIAQTSEALRMNLSFLTALSLFVAVLLGYQVISLVTLRRRDEFAVLTSLGASPRNLAGTILIEALFIGAIAGLFGALLGHLLGEYTVSAVQNSINYLYTPLWGQGGSILSGALLLESILLGAATALLGAASPAYVVSQREPGAYFSREASVQPVALHHAGILLLALLFLILGAASSDRSFITAHPLAPFVSPSLLSFGVLLLAYPLLIAIRAFVRRFRNSLGPSWILATDSIAGRLRDMSISVGALSVAFGMLVGVATMISSFRVTFQDWLGFVLRADIFISEYDEARLPSKNREKALEWLREQKDVGIVSTGEQKEYLYDDRKVFLRWSDLEVANKKNTIVFLEKGTNPYREVNKRRGVFISEPFSKRFQKSIGEELELVILGETERFAIQGVYQDFSTDLGVILMDSSQAQKLSLKGERGLGISLYMKDDANHEQLIEKFEEEFPSLFDVRGRRVLEEQALQIFDNTFKITYVLQFLTLGISSLFLVLTLCLSVLDRRKEQLTLRSIGASFRHLQGILLRESLLLSGCVVFLGLSLGVLLSLVLVYRINVIFFGWSVSLLFPFFSIGSFCFGFLLIAAAVSSLVGYWGLRKIPVEVLRYE